MRRDPKRRNSLCISNCSFVSLGIHAFDGQKNEELLDDEEEQEHSKDFCVRTLCKDVSGRFSTKVRVSFWDTKSIQCLKNEEKNKKSKELKKKA